MVRTFLKKFIVRKRKALSLVEIIVAIGISAITLTTSSVFSTRLMIRAQQNFMDDSAVQLTNIIVEQLRLAESEMQQVKIINAKGGNSIPRVFRSLSEWQDFCNVGGNPNLFVDIPRAVSGGSTHNVQIGFLNGQANSNVEGINYLFQNITDREKLTGAFYTGSNSAVQELGVGIQKTINNSSSALGEVINVNVVIRYYLFNIKTTEYTKYSRPTTVKMIKSTVC